MTATFLSVLAAVMPAHVWRPGYGPGWFILIPIFWILMIGFFISLAEGCSGAIVYKAIHGAPKVS